MFRGVPLSIHSAVEAFAAPAIMVAPFLFGFGPAATAVSIAVGAVMLALALQAESPKRTVPLVALAGFDYALAAFAVVGGIAIGLVAGEWQATSFLVGVGAAMVALTASTRFSMARSV